MTLTGYSMVQMIQQESNTLRRAALDALFKPPTPVDPLSIPCEECGSPAGTKCTRMTYNRPVRTMAKGGHHRRRKDAELVTQMRDALA